MTASPPRNTRTLEIPALDGYGLAATVYEPATPTHRAVLIAGGTGIARRYYDAFARFLQEHGFYTVTFDYRGIGGSRPPSLRGFEASMHSWGQQDIAGVLGWIARALQPAQTYYVGHSAGAQIIGLASNSPRLAAAVMVTPPHGYWKLWPPLQRPRLALLWFALMPMLARTLGYFPSKRFGLGEDLPRGVALEWAAWCRNPGYLFASGDTLDLSRYPTLTFPILAYSFTDDAFAPRPSVEALLGRYAGAAITHNRLAPGDIGETAIGHFGFFRERFRNTLWKETTDWLKRQA